MYQHIAAGKTVLLKFHPSQIAIKKSGIISFSMNTSLNTSYGILLRETCVFEKGGSYNTCMHEVNFGVAFDNAKTGAKGIVRADDWNGLSEAFL